MAAEAFYKRSDTAIAFLLLRFLAVGVPQPYREAGPIWHDRVIDPRIGGETRRPDREAIVFGVVQQVLPVCTTWC
jgi:hypothetical protein